MSNRTFRVLYMNEVLSTGTTTVAVIVKDAVVLATDRRVTADHFIAHKIYALVYLHVLGIFCFKNTIYKR